MPEKNIINQHHDRDEAELSRLENQVDEGPDRRSGGTEEKIHLDSGCSSWRTHRYHRPRLAGRQNS